MRMHPWLNQAYETATDNGSMGTSVCAENTQSAIRPQTQISNTNIVNSSSMGSSVVDQNTSQSTAAAVATGAT